MPGRAGKGTPGHTLSLRLFLAFRTQGGTMKPITRTRMMDADDQAHLMATKMESTHASQRGTQRCGHGGARLLLFSTERADAASGGRP